MENGFAYFDSIYDLQDAFYEEGYSLDGFEEVNVPGMWQRSYGYPIRISIPT